MRFSTFSKIEILGPNPSEMMTLRLQILKFSLLTQRPPQVLRTAHPTPPGCAPHFWWGGLCVSRENFRIWRRKVIISEGFMQPQNVMFKFIILWKSEVQASSRNFLVMSKTWCLVLFAHARNRWQSNIRFMIYVPGGIFWCHDVNLDLDMVIAEEMDLLNLNA